MIQSFAARERGFDEDAQIVFDLLLADVFAQELGAQGEFDLLVLIKRAAADQTRFIFRIGCSWFFARHNLVTLPTFSVIVSAQPQNSRPGSHSTRPIPPSPPTLSDNRD